MLFNSYQFIVFFVIVFLVYYLLPYKFRWMMLLGVSYYFYMCWEPRLIILMLISTVIHYFAALEIARLNKCAENSGEDELKKKIILYLSVGMSLGILFLFKYFDFFSESIISFLKFINVQVKVIKLNLILPMGISFYTFQTLSYTIDVYNRKVLPEKHFGYFALYVSFFPQLVAGPIERVDKLLPQLKAKHEFNYEEITYGLKLMAIGYFKKIVIADTLAKGVNRVYNNVENYTGLALIMATVMFAFQIYCDFSGYSDIAIGCANTMGIRLMQNFRCPYLSGSIKEFWSRWHISLSAWFRDYVYIPLGGNRAGKWYTYKNLMITFLLSGLWHGANWTYVIWGGVHGCYQVIERKIGTYIFIKNSNNLVLRGVKILLTFSLVCFAWIFFRANSISDAIYIIRNMFVGITNPLEYLKRGVNTLGKFVTLVLMAELLILFILDVGQEAGLVKNVSEKWWVRWGIYIIFGILLVFLSSKNAIAEFIYFQF